MNSKLYFLLAPLILFSCSSYEDAEKQFRSEFHLKDSISTEYGARILGFSRRDIIERYEGKN